MKPKFGIRFAGLCGVCAALVLNVSGASAPASSSAPALSRAEALKIVTESRHYVAHPTKAQGAAVTESKVTMPDFAMDSPPPAALAETKPETSAPGMVWVAGHYMPVKGEWRWVKGEWAVPALPISVWIAARYDEKEKQWYPGYWQPDLPGPGPTDGAAAKDPKTAPPTNNGY